jgi:hypothetical protein
MFEASILQKPADRKASASIFPRSPAQNWPGKPSSKLFLRLRARIPQAHFRGARQPGAISGMGARADNYPFKPLNCFITRNNTASETTCQFGGDFETRHKLRR